MQKQKGVSTILGVIVIVVVAVVLFGAIFAYQYFAKPQIQNPNSEIAGLPSQSQQAPAGWKTYKGNGFEFQYPISGRVTGKTSEGGALAWVPLFWPPQVKIVSINEDVVRACPVSQGGYYNQLASSRRFVEINGFGNPITLYKLSYPGTRSFSLRYCYVAKSTKTENYIVYFDFTSIIDPDRAMEKDVDALTEEIISTFKFTSFESQAVSLLVWPDVKTFNLTNKTFRATGLDSQNKNKVFTITTDKSTKFYNMVDGKVIEYHDFNWLYETLKNWVGPTWHFTVNGKTQSNGSVLASEIYYTIQ